MIPAGILLYVATRPAYGIPAIILYYVSGIIGAFSSVNIVYRKEYRAFKAFLLSVVITSFIMALFTFSEAFFKGTSAINGLLAWFPALIIVLLYKAFAISMSIFPIVVFCFYIYRKLNR